MSWFWKQFVSLGILPFSEACHSLGSQLGSVLSHLPFQESPHRRARRDHEGVVWNEHGADKKYLPQARPAIEFG